MRPGPLVRVALAALLIAGVSGSTVAVTPAAPAAAAVPAGCEPVAIVAFRGSGERNVDAKAATLAGSTQKYKNLETNGWEGPMLKKLLTSYVNTPSNSAWPTGFSPDDVPVISIGYDGKEGYPAVEVKKSPNIFNDLILSSTQGAKYALTQLADFQSRQPAGCKTKFIGIGYSQGAMASRVLAQGSSSNFAGVVNFGDPYQKPNSSGNEGEAANGEGILRWFVKDPSKKIIDAYYDIEMHKSALCHTKDPICSYSWIFGAPALAFAIDTHLNYLEIGTEARDKGTELANLAASVVKSAQAAPVTPPKRKALDTVFVIDTTGSMQPYINSAVDAARSSAAAILSSATSGRVGLVEYKDHGDTFVSRAVVPLTSSADAFEAGLSTLYADGGGDFPEALFSGVIEAARSNWARSASRAIVVIADAPAHDPEPVTGYTSSFLTSVLNGTTPVPPSVARRVAASESGPGVDDRSQAPNTGESAPPTFARAAASRNPATATATALSADAVPISLYAISADAELTDQISPITEATGGLTLTIDDPSELSTLIIDSVEHASAGPEAVAAIAGPTLTGLPFILSAANSTVYAGAATFEYDTDGDGVYDLTSTDPATEVTVAATGPVTFSVRVTDDQNRSSVASATVDVLDSAEATRAIPDPADPSTALSGVSLSSAVISVGGSTTLSVSDLLGADELVGARLVPRSTTTASPWEVLPVDGFGGFTAEAARGGALLSPSSATPADVYTLLVFTDEGRHAEVSLTILAADGPTPTDSVDPEPGTPATPGSGQPPRGSGPGQVAVAGAGTSKVVRSLPVTGADITAPLALVALALLLLAMGAAMNSRVAGRTRRKS